MTVRVRFAPSPTGYLHIGSARTALFNWLYARARGGKFLLRVEDTDLDRAAALRLIQEGKAYRDFTPKGERADANVKQEIAERARTAAAGEGVDHRANPYRDLPSEESEQRAAAGGPFAVRLKVSPEGRTRFADAVYGEQTREHSEIEDLVLLRSGDLSPLYNLSVVVDDIEMGITHVIRGQDHLTNTHKQILIYEALAAEVPRFAHLPLILAPNKAKLSKRKHGEVVSLTTYRDRGFVPAAFRNYLALLGWSPGEENREIMSLEELVSLFSLEGVHRSNAVFNFSDSDPRQWTDQKALWMNSEYVRTMPLEELLPMVKSELESAGLWRAEYEGAESEWFGRTVELIRQRFITLKDFSGQGRAYFAEEFEYDPAAVAKNLKKDPALRELLPALAERV